MIATSTIEAEFVSYFEATTHDVRLKSFIFGLRIVDSISKPLRMYCDNSVVIFLAKNNKSESQGKHIDIKNLSIRECVKENKVITKHINTKLIIVDPLTKGMPLSMFKDHVSRMGLSTMLNFLYTYVYL